MTRKDLMRITPIAALALALVACGKKEEAPPAPAPAAAAPAAPVAAEPVQRTSEPLPAPGERGLSARHGGLVESVDGVGFELVADAAGAKVYLYDAAGAPLTAADASGSLVASAEGKSATLALKPTSAEGGTVLVGEGALPAVFEAQLELKVGTASPKATLRWGAGGIEGSSKVPEGEQFQTTATPPAAAPGAAPVTAQPGSK